MPRRSNAPQQSESADDDLVFVQEEFPAVTMPQISRAPQRSGHDLVFVQEEFSTVHRDVPTQWPNLYAASEAAIPTSENTEYGTACFFMMFMSRDSEDPTFAAITSGLTSLDPLIIPRGNYKLRVGIYSKGSPGESSGHPIGLQKGSYTEKHNINFTGDSDPWQVVVSYKSNTNADYTSETFSGSMTEQYKFTAPKATAKMTYSSPLANSECTILIRQVLSRIKLKAEIWCDVKHAEVALPLEEQFQKIPVELEVWVRGV
jgi:hypothetical protein